MKNVLVISYGESDKNGGVASLCDLTNVCFELGFRVAFVTPFGKLDRLIYKKNLLKNGIPRKVIRFSDIYERTYLHGGLKVLIQKFALLLFGSVEYRDYDFIVDGVGLSPEILRELKIKNIKVLRNHAGSPSAFYDFFLSPDSNSNEDERKCAYIRIMNNYSGGIFQSQSHMDEFLNLTNLSKKDSVCIPPTVSETFDSYLKNFDSSCKQNRKLVMIGSIQRRKGQMHAIKLLESLNDSVGKQFKLHIFGNVIDDDYYDCIKTYIEHHDLLDQVYLKGFSSDYIRELAESFCLLIMSEAEGVPRVVREALSLNVPVIGYRFGDICEKISENSGGYFVEYGLNAEIADVIINRVQLMQGRRAYENIFHRASYKENVTSFFDN